MGAHFLDGLLFTKQLADAEVNFKFIAINIALITPGYYESLGKLAEGILCPTDWAPGAKFTPDLAKRLGVERF